VPNADADAGAYVDASAEIGSSAGTSASEAVAPPAVEKASKRPRAPVRAQDHEEGASSTPSAEPRPPAGDAGSLSVPVPAPTPTTVPADPNIMQ
jgi:hypothetical protein